jgi:hypothetical protein
MREDFVRGFGVTPLLSAEPVETSKRSEMFKPPFYGLTSRLESPVAVRLGRSGASAAVLAALDDSPILEVAASADGSQVWILDEDNRVFSVNEKSLAQINRTLPLMSIAWDRRLGLVGAQWDEARLYRFAGNSWRSVRTGIRPEHLTSSGRDDALAILRKDASTYS